ncbi:hypothetical protein Hdeb2414_s0012g00391801 [Helianthus debilis subsp. tardiflorus]
MKMASQKSLFLIVLTTIAISGILTQVKAYSSSYCGAWTRCEGQTIYCPSECPSNDPQAKVCRIDCYSPICKAECKRKRYFYIYFTLVSYIYAHFYMYFTQMHSKLDLRCQPPNQLSIYQPEGRSRDFTWIQALGLLFNSHSSSLEATKSASWDGEIDHLKFSYDGDVSWIRVMVQGKRSRWSHWIVPTEDCSMEMELFARNEG